jgi:neutral ceramidase
VHAPWSASFVCAAWLSACSDATPPASDAAAPSDLGAAVDAGPADVQPLSTAHCTYVPVPPTGGAGGVVTAGAVSAGVSEGFVDLPVGSALGAYTGRARFFGSEGVVDRRTEELSAWFAPSVGVESRTRVRALALTAGDETALILKADLGAAETAVAFDVAAALGPAYAGKVIFATSHSHSAMGHTITNEGLSTLGFGPWRAESYRRLVEALVRVSREALAARVPARVGIAHDPNFDPEHRVSRDRRRDNDDLPDGRDRKDRDLFVVRVDTRDGQPMAILPVFGVHPTVLGGDNNLASGDVPGAIERALEEHFDRRVLVMHLQGAAGDVSPGGATGLDCGEERRGPARFCYDFAQVETVGRLAMPSILATWGRAEAALRAEVEMEVLTRSVALGPDWRTFTVRDGGLSYASFDPEREADGVLFNDAGAVASPIDEFRAPGGAALCGNEMGSYPPAAIRGVSGLRPYRSCNRVEVFTRLVNTLIAPYEPIFEPGRALCGSTRTAVSALRLGGHLFVTLPGEPLTILADRARALSPVAPENTIVLGYANGHVGYLLTADDWLRGGYEANINFWGPLEGEYIVERAMELARLAVTPAREDGQRGGVDRWALPREDNTPLAPDAPQRAGTVPEEVPREVYARRGVYSAAEGRLTRAQPAPEIARLDSARFVWIGDDPHALTPTVTIEREVRADVWEPVARRSGRLVEDGDFLLTTTPLPLERAGTQPRTHYWAVEWQLVPPTGAGDEALEDRIALPLGRYRFRARGAAYDLRSDAFRVTPRPLSVSATRADAMVTLNVSYHSPTGWRLLSMRERPNAPIPMRRPLTVELLLRGGGARTLTNVMPAEAGRFRVDLGADAANVTDVRVRDAADNAGTVNL